MHEDYTWTGVCLITDAFGDLPAASRNSCADDFTLSKPWDGANPPQPMHASDAVFAFRLEAMCVSNRMFWEIVYVV